MKILWFIHIVSKMSLPHGLVFKYKQDNCLSPKNKVRQGRSSREIFKVYFLTNNSATVKLCWAVSCILVKTYLHPMSIYQAIWTIMAWEIILDIWNLGNRKPYWNCRTICSYCNLKWIIFLVGSAHCGDIVSPPNTGGSRIVLSFPVSSVRKRRFLVKK